jgi:hypothetical protein
VQIVECKVKKKNGKTTAKCKVTTVQSTATVTTSAPGRSAKLKNKAGEIVAKGALASKMLASAAIPAGDYTLIVKKNNKRTTVKVKIP